MARSILRLLSAVLIAGFLFPVLSCDFSFKGGPDNKEPDSEEPTSWDMAQPLKEIYQNQFLMGNIISPRDLGTVRFDILKRHYNTATAENHMKPSEIAPLSQPVSGDWVYRWTQADSIVKAVNDAGLKMHGHTLIWHSQSPAWLSSGDKETALANLQKYVTEVTTHFKGKLISWDVVNEAMRDGLTTADAANWKNCLRRDDSAWNRNIGYEYIEQAFLAARNADKDVKLFYNDYNLNNANKARAVYNMVNDINSRYSNVEGRKLIDGIGMQSHHHIYTDPKTVDNAISLFTSLGVEIAISEMDIQAANTQVGSNPTLPWGDDAAQRQAKQYVAMFKVFKKYTAHISRVTFWGLDDETSWRASTYPTLLDKDYGLKPAFYAVMNPDKF